MKMAIIGSVILMLGGCNSFSQTAKPADSMMNWGIGSLPIVGNVETRSLSPENPTGEKGKGGMAEVNDPKMEWSGPAKHLGQGWKVSPFYRLRAGETLTFMDVDGPGMIQHIWMTFENMKDIERACVLRFYWDGEKEPSIEVPATDFFAVGHDQIAPVNSAVVVVNPASALNCYWPMPFRKHAKITFSNEDDRDISLVTYQITYAKMEVPVNAAYFHAQWRRAVVDKKNANYTIVDNIKGQGKYVGTFLAWSQLHSGWDMEGEVKCFIDGDGQFLTICGTGTEDYFCASYGFTKVYSTAYNGCTLDNRNTNAEYPEPRKWSLYRWHLMDPIHFKADYRMTIQVLGWYKGKPNYRPTDDDIASTAYWYQMEPHNSFPALPELKDRWPR